MRRFLALAFVFGCGSADDKKHLDAAVDAPKPGADAAQPACNLTAPFGTPVNVGGVNTSSTESWGWLSADGLTIYFTSTPSGLTDFNIYTATRAQPSGNFSNVQPLDAVNTTNTESRPVLTADGLNLFLAYAPVGANMHIYTATRASTAADFSTPIVAPALNSNGIDANPWISADGLTLYLASTRSGANAGDYDIFRATRTTTTMMFGMPTAVPELNMSNTVDDAPVLSADGLEIFFASTRGVVGASARNNVWHATRSTTNDGFGTPAKIAELGTDATEDYPNWISPDRCTLIYTSDRPGGNGGYDLWMASRPE